MNKQTNKQTNEQKIKLTWKNIHPYQESNPEPPITRRSLQLRRRRLHQQAIGIQANTGRI